MEIDNICLDCNYRVTCNFQGKMTNCPGCLQATGDEDNIPFIVADAIDNGS